jgi:hypothetical protein
MMTPVRFLLGWGLYNAGEIAGFEPGQSQALVAAGVAELVASGVNAPDAADAAAPAATTAADAPRRGRSRRG